MLALPAALNLGVKFPDQLLVPGRLLGKQVLPYHFVVAPVQRNILLESEAQGAVVNRLFVRVGNEVEGEEKLGAFEGQVQEDQRKGLVDVLIDRIAVLDEELEIISGVGVEKVLSVLLVLVVLILTPGQSGHRVVGDGEFFPFFHI